MQPSTRAIVAASAYAVLTQRKVAGLYDHDAGRHLRIAAESRENKLQGLDGERNTRFGGTLPELFDAGAGAFVSLEAEGMTARGYDRGAQAFYEARVGERQVQLYDHGVGAWFAFDIQVADADQD